MASHPPERRLVLWDVDHTLIETRGVGTLLYRSAFETVTGRSVEHHVEITGRTELAIVAESLRLHGIEASDHVIERYRVELVKQYEENSDELRERGRALPGAVEALAALAKEPGVVQTVLTGNLRAVALVKLRAFGLDQYIDFEAGAFGEDDSKRAQLVAVARQRAGAKYSARFTRLNTVIIGDTANDVIAAHEGGARAVAVASGASAVGQLLEAGAEVVLPDLVDTAQVVEAVFQP